MPDPLAMVALEICANSITSALAAQEGGAARVELCQNLMEGGTTPSYGEIKLARELLDIKLYILIRPRGGDFLYSALEYKLMLADARFCMENGCDGIVTGILKTDGTIDKERCTEFKNIAEAYGGGVTFHRAFDMCNDHYRALEDIIDLGFERILTSGGKTTAMEGAPLIAHLIEKAAGRITIMPGSGISETNIADLVRFTGASEVHSSARSRVQSGMNYRNEHIIMSHSHGDDYSIQLTDTAKVKELIDLANASHFSSD